MTTNRIGHHTHHLGRGQHADLDGINTDVTHHCIDLTAHRIQWNAVNSRHAQSVLHRDGRDGSHAITAQRRTGLEVGLNTGTTAAIRAGNGENARIAFFRCGKRGGGSSLSHSEKLSSMCAQGCAVLMVVL